MICQLSVKEEQARGVVQMDAELKQLEEEVLRNGEKLLELQKMMQSLL